jgi:hypothetical protein
LLGINAGNFASNVSITGNNGNTIVTIGTDTITFGRQFDHREYW